MKKKIRRRVYRASKGKKADFWRAWQAERERLWREAEHDEAGTSKRSRSTAAGGFSPRTRARHWRSFFHDYMGEYPETHWAFSGRRFSPWRKGADNYNPLVASLLSKGGGLLPLYVLNLLAQRPHYGNEVMEALTERTAGQWLANPGAIYPLMTMLENQALIEGSWDDPRKRTVRKYVITKKGEAELLRLAAIVRPKLDEALDILQELADDLDDIGATDEVL